MPRNTLWSWSSGWWKWWRDYKEYCPILGCLDFCSINSLYFPKSSLKSITTSRPWGLEHRVVKQGRRPSSAAQMMNFGTWQREQDRNMLCELNYSGKQRLEARGNQQKCMLPSPRIPQETGNDSDFLLNWEQDQRQLPLNLNGQETSADIWLIQNYSE